MSLKKTPILLSIIEIKEEYFWGHKCLCSSFALKLGQTDGKKGGEKYWQSKVTLNALVAYCWDINIQKPISKIYRES